MEIPTGQDYNHGISSRAQTWANQGAPQAYEPTMQPYPHFDYARGKPFSSQFYPINLGSADNYQQHGWSPHRNGGGSAANGIPTSPVGTSSISSTLSVETILGFEENVFHCGKEFRSSSDLTKHQKPRTKRFICLLSGCDKAFTKNKDLLRHARSHQKGDGWRCTVDGCRKTAAGRVFARKDNLYRHHRTEHAHDTQGGRRCRAEWYSNVKSGSMSGNSAGSTSTNPPPSIDMGDQDADSEMVDDDSWLA